MVATRRRGRSEAELPEDDGGEIEVPEKQAVDNDSSEDDAPEEITLDRGKQVGQSSGATTMVSKSLAACLPD